VLYLVHSCTWPQPYSSMESPIWLCLLLDDNWTWTSKWQFRWLLWLNALSHRWHLCGFSPLWIFSCLFRFPAVVNRFPQTEHSNGFSPEWNRLCIVNAWLPWKTFPDSLHLNLLVWILTALESAAMHIHMPSQLLLSRKAFVTFSTWIHLVTVCFTVSLQCTFRCKLFITICAHTWSWVAVICRFSGISFILHFIWNFTCKKCTITQYTGLCTNIISSLDYQAAVRCEQRSNKEFITVRNMRLLMHNDYSAKQFCHTLLIWIGINGHLQ